MGEPRAVGDLAHVEKFFARNLGGLIRVRQGMPDRLMQAKSRTMSMHADEESDEGIVPMKRSNNGSLLPAEIVEGRASPKENGGNSPDTEPGSCVEPTGRRAPSGATRQDSAVHCAAASHHRRSADAKLQRTQA